MFYVYIIQSNVDGSFYIGYTTHLEKRLAEHNAGLSRYTSRKVPWILFYSETFDNKSDAIKRERFLKNQKNKAFYLRLAGRS